MSFVVNNFSLNDCNSGYAGNKKQNKILSEDCVTLLSRFHELFIFDVNFDI